MMKDSQKITLIALLLMVGAGVAGMILSRSRPSVPPRNKNAQAQNAARITLNQQYLDTAKRLSARATTAGEQQVAQAALHNADQELDLEFAADLQAAGRQPTVQSPEVREIQERIGKIQASIETKQAEVTQLTDVVKTAKGDQQAALQQQLDVSQAELNFYKERLDDIKDDLIRAGGDPHSRVQQLVKEHEAASQSADSVKFPPLREPASEPSSLLAQWSEWKAIRRKQNQILQAQQEAVQAADALTMKYGPLQQQVMSEQAQRKATVARASGPQGPPVGPSITQVVPVTKQAAKAAIALLQRTSQDQKTLAIMGRRIRSLQNLGLTYDQWVRLISADARAVLHDILASAVWILVLMLLVFGINRLMERFFARLTLENKQRATLQAVFRISIQVVTVLVILVVIFGPPNQLSTVLGLAGAGLTVVLKDFIVSFLGWFVLMGRHGIHVGDWVEINGVRGEVIEISLLRTVLLETGNWTDSGQPTGRQVAFLNQYAVDGYYFNFSTSGQWLWDELQVVIPGSQDPYPLVEKIRAIVEKETEGNTHLAEREWQRVSRRYGVRSFSAQPTVNVKPTDTGVVVMVRYITRAEERSESRFRLNHAVVKLLHAGAELAAPPESPSAPETAHRPW
ncbi:MAG TPA: mechanosensitive ion channel domain-containing protein [Terriglobia bacterium]|nr:mechanosensitive ion channel domain-containing protein [Terriglobia bacterium]